MYAWTASISLHDAHLSAHGTQRCDRYRATWELTTSPGWITREVDVVLSLDPDGVVVDYPDLARLTKVAI